MEDDRLTEFILNEHALKLVLNCVRNSLNTWPGGPPEEQQALNMLVMKLQRSVLEYDFHK